MNLYYSHLPLKKARHKQAKRLSKNVILAKPSIKSIYLHFQTMSIDSNAKVHSNTRTKHSLFCPWAEVMAPEVFLIDQENHSGITKPTFLQDTN